MCSIVALAAQLKWCASSSAAFKKCQKVGRAIGHSISCVLGSNDIDCCKKIANKNADMGLFGGVETYYAGES